MAKTIQHLFLTTPMAQAKEQELAKFVSTVGFME